MNGGSYIALSGIIAQQERLDMVTNNLSNVNTVGYKSTGAVFGDFLSQSSIDAQNSASQKPLSDKAYPIELGTYNNVSQGPIKKTGNSLDLAIDGQGYFAVITPDGIKFTRNGVFSLNQAGELVSQEGYPVLSVSGIKKSNGQAGEINISDAKPVFLNESGSDITISGSGIISLNDPKTGNGVYAGKILTVNFKNPQYLSKYGNTLFSATQNSGGPLENKNTNILQGYLEESNVNMIGGMVQMIDVSEVYNNMMQALKSYSQVNNSAINTVGAAV